MTSEYRADLAPVSDDGLTIKPRVDLSWTVDDSHHPVLEAVVQGNLLAVTMGGHEFRVSTVQSDALLKVLTAWKRTWTE